MYSYWSRICDFNLQHKYL